MDLVIYLYSIYYVLKFEFGCTCCVINLYSSCLLCVDVVFGILMSLVYLMTFAMLALHYVPCQVCNLDFEGVFLFGVWIP